MGGAETLLARRKKGRQRWVDLPGGRRVCLQRPPALQLTGYLRPAAEEGKVQIRASLEDVKACAADWSGFTEADLVPGGGADAVPFDAALFADWLEDEPEQIAPIAQALVALVSDYYSARADAEKN